MATLSWAVTAGDWYSASNWQLVPSGQHGIPVAGDFAFINSGTAQITAADVASFGTLDNMTLTIGASDPALSPLLQADGETFGSHFRLRTAGSNGNATIMATGSLLFAGTIAVDATSGTLDIALRGAPFGGSGGGSYSLTGPVELNGGASLVLSTDGTGIAALAIQNAPISISAGTLSLGDRFATQDDNVIALTGGALIVGSGSQIEIAGTGARLTEGAAASLLIAGEMQVDNGATIATDGSVVLNGSLSIDSTGRFNDINGTGTIGVGVNAQVAATGTIGSGLTITDAGTVTLNAIASAASVTITLGALAEITGTVAAGANFQLERGAILRLDNAAAFNGTISAFGYRGTIDLVGITADNTVYDPATGLLDVRDGDSVVAQLHFATAPDVVLSHDAGNGTNLVQLPSNAQLAAREVGFITGIDAGGTLTTQNFWTWSGGSNPPSFASTGSAHKYGGGVTGSPGGTVFYWFDSASNWSAADQQGFIAGMAMWSDIANVQFAPAASAAAATLMISRAAPGAGTGVTATYQSVTAGSTTLAATTLASLAYDTSPYVWSQPSSFTVAGGYGLLTVLHELGHVLGFGHAGFYNGSITPSTDQYGPYDTEMWTVMSYLSPLQTDALYYQQYPVTGTTRGVGADRYQFFQTSWGMLDIQAVQQLYGLPTSTPLSGGQVFGFNSNIAGPSGEFFDFTINTNPVITIWDAGSGNTLDLSGFPTNSFVDLVPGTFSNVDGMVNNLAIAPATAIDTALGGPGDDVFVVNANADRIDGGAGTNMVQFPEDYSSYTVDFAGSGILVSTGGITDTLTNVQRLKFADQTVTVPCFAAGTRILTSQGEAPVEALSLADRVVTIDGKCRPIIWIGRREVDIANHPSPDRVRPILIRHGAFGLHRPHRDLVLSPDHAVFVDGVLIPARYLVDGDAIAPLPTSSVTYYHIELDRHDVVIAEGLAAESYLDTGDRASFAGLCQPDRTDADRCGLIREAQAYAELIVVGPLLQAVRSRVARYRSIRRVAATDRTCSALDR